MAENNWLEGRHALVTGGGTGIGASAATHLHAAGAEGLVLFGRVHELDIDVAHLETSARLEYSSAAELGQ